jgi:hypothetical protein
LLTANRYDQIKVAVRLYQTDPQVALVDVTINEALDMLVDLAKDFDRMRQVVQLQGGGGRGHLKPVVLDSQGEPVVPPPISQQLAVERRMQYDADRFEAVMAIPDLEPWRVFSLRWGLAPPPGGWTDTSTILRLIHTVRLGIKAVPYIDKHFSAVTLSSQGIKLPPGVALINGTLTGVEHPDPT